MSNEEALKLADLALRVAEQATEGPWESWYPEDFEVAGPKEIRICELPHAISPRHRATAEFIAWCRQGVPVLAAALKKQAQENARLSNRLKEGKEK